MIPDLSELEILNCAAGGSHQPVDPAIGLAYIRSNGIVLESDYPYVFIDHDGVCDVTAPPAYFIDNYNKVNLVSQPVETRVETIKNALMANGPLIVYFEKPKGYHCISPNYDYGVDPTIEREYWALAGWQDDPDVINGGYWIVRFTYSDSYGYCQVHYGFSHIDDVYYSVNYSGSWPSNIRPYFSKYFGTITAMYNETLSVEFHAEDPDGDTVTYSITNKPAGATFDTSTGLLEWLPGHAAIGKYNIKVTASDGNASMSQDAVIDVKSKPPVFKNIYGRLYETCGNQITLDFSAIDPEGDPVTYAISLIPNGATFNTSTGLLEGQVKGNGWFEFTVQAMDTDNTISQKVTFVIDYVSPVFNVEYDIVGGIVDEELVLDLSATDPIGMDIEYQLTNQPPRSSFDLTTQIFRYTPTAVGKITFGEKAMNLCRGNSRSITIDIQGENYPPTIINLLPEYKGNEGSLLRIQVEGNDLNHDKLTFFGANLPSGASIDAETGIFKWTPNYFQSGSYRVTFGVSDGEFQDTAETTLVIGNVNGPPSFKNLIPDYSGREGTLINLDFSAIDPDNEPVAYSVTSLPPGASLDPATGQFLWTPSYTSNGEYGMTVYATDGKRTSSQFVHFSIANVKTINK